MWGASGIQSHYEAGRSLQTVKKDSIEGICACGYLTLKPSSKFEDDHGGLTVRRSKVVIIDDNGNLVKRLRGKQFNHYWNCKACVNNWK